MPDTSTEVAIATTTLGAAASTITFSSIPGTYTDLRLVVLGIDGTGNFALRFNSDSGTNYSRTYMQGDGTSAISARNTSTIRAPIGNVYPDQFSICEVDIFSYAGSTNKTLLYKGSADQNGSGTIQVGVDLWRSTSAITSIQIVNDTGGNFDIGTTATLYGIL